MKNEMQINKFFDNLSSIAEQLERMVENGQPLSEGTAEKVAEFNSVIQQLEEKSLVIR
ncbi:MAG: hypothetical protein J6K17_09325 [Oscillospiraceae bacterium]|nr:hypothetical protein [Oscillospiraceae bacterium]